MRADILKQVLDSVDPDALKVDGFDKAIIGTAYRCGLNRVLAYDVNKIIKKLISQGMNEEEAWEYFEFNIEGAYMGEYTPIFIKAY
jgi:hypothetical protein